MAAHPTLITTPHGYGDGYAQPQLAAARDQEIARLREALRAAQADKERLASSLKQYEEASRRSGEELSAFKEAMASREEELVRQRQEEHQRMATAVEDYQQQFQAERLRLQEALQRNFALTHAAAGGASGGGVATPGGSAGNPSSKGSIDLLPGNKGFPGN
ncbi:hypothetical protein T484DRAFT_1889397, partial [Baffinella frigidus]